MTNIVYARTVATLAHQGQRYRIRPGDPWDGDDPIVKRYPDMFRDGPSAVRSTTEPGGFKRVVDPLEESPIERATRAPGERRRTRKGGGQR